MTRAVLDFVLITEADVARLAELRAYAERPENLFTLERQRARFIPGERAEFCHTIGDRIIGTLRLVYTITLSNEGAPHRHLSFSARYGIPVQMTGLPSVAFASHVARTYFGFTGTVEDWMVTGHEHGSIHILQAIAAGLN